ncbi:hypothetical protein E4U21_001866 [Claviceps maximensis]|nr:hypothetical protein E4U21_001866 [Claviceps maximensis]
MPDRILLSDVIDMQSRENEIASTPWACYPATDVIKFSRQTEGAAFDGQLNILLSGVFSVRHMIYSVVNLPPTARPRLKFTINTTSVFDTKRTFIGLLLLCLAGNDDLIMTAEAVIHLWYSSRVPEDLYAFALKREANAERRAKKSPVSFLNDADPSHRRTTLEWEQKNIKLMLDLSDKQTFELHNPAPAASDLNFVMKDEERRKFVKSFFGLAARMTRGRALGLLMWQEDGLLLPYDHPRDRFHIPNPIVFGDGSKHWHCAIAEPLSEWPMEFLDHPIQDFVAENDVYGKMFYYLRSLLMRFQIRCQQLHMEIEICSIAPKQMHEYLKINPKDKFDRIEDENPALCLFIGAKFLNDTRASPCATLLTMSRESVELDGRDNSKASLDQISELFIPTSTVLDEYTRSYKDSAWKAGQCPEAKDVARRRVGTQIYLRDPKLFGFYLLGHEGRENMRSVVETGFLGLECMRKNKITKRWPNRLIHSRSDNPGIEKFDRYVGWVDNKPQRWLEWQLEEPLDDEQLDFWARLCTTMRPEEMRYFMTHAVDRLQQGDIAATTDSDAKIDLSWIDEGSNTGTATTVSPDSTPKKKSKGKKNKGKAKK